MNATQQTLPLADVPANKYSSTDFRYKDKHCGYAMKLHRDGVPENDDIFQVGIAAHEVLRAVGEHRVEFGDFARMEKVANGVYSELITNGHTYFGRKFPPMPARFASDGRDLALAWLKENSLPPDGQFEIVLAMDAEGKPCSLDDNYRWRAKIDSICVIEDGDEESNWRLVRVDDHKSAWSAGEDELDSLQRRSQAVLAQLHYPDCDGVKLVINNLRTNKSYSRTIFFDEEGLELLRVWRNDILMQCDAADKNLEPRPGAGCVDCPFADRCEAATKVAAAADNAAALAVIENQRDRLKRNLRRQLENAVGIQCGAGWVGYKLMNSRIVGDNARRQLLANWFETPIDEVDTKLGAEKGLLVLLNPGVTAYERFVKARFGGEHRVEREEFMSFLDEEKSIEFGVWKNGNGHAEALPLLPENTVLADPPPKPDKKKPGKPARAKAKKAAKPVKRRKAGKKNSAKRKTAAKRKAVIKKNSAMRKIKGNVRRKATKKPKVRYGRKARK